MTTATSLKIRLLDSLASVIDGSLSEVGFLRQKSSLTYIRVLEDSEHHITFVMDCYPKYQPGAEAHIHPKLQLRMRKVSDLALDLVKGDRRLLADAPEILVNQPIEFTAPKDEHERWFATGSEQFQAVCEAIKGFLFRWVLPFLSEVSTPQDLVKLYEANDGRLMKQKHWYIFVAAAYQASAMPEKAREVVQQHFSRPGLRKRYAGLFESLGLEQPKLSKE